MCFRTPWRLARAPERVPGVAGVLSWWWGPLHEETAGRVGVDNEQRDVLFYLHRHASSMPCTIVALGDRQKQRDPDATQRGPHSKRPGGAMAGLAHEIRAPLPDVGPSQGRGQGATGSCAMQPNGGILGRRSTPAACWQWRCTCIRVSTKTGLGNCTSRFAWRDP